MGAEAPRSIAPDSDAPTLPAPGQRAVGDLTRVRDVHGHLHSVLARDLANPAKKMLRRYGLDGTPLETTPYSSSIINRDNIDDDARTKAREAWKDISYFAVTSGDRDVPFKTIGAAKAAVKRHAQPIEEFEIRPVSGGYVAVRPAKEKLETTVPDQEANHHGGGRQRLPSNRPSNHCGPAPPRRDATHWKRRSRASSRHEPHAIRR